jgi:hypothetical protein
MRARGGAARKVARRLETGYVWGMTLEAIKEAIEQLPAEQQAILADWISERDWQAWDKQIERDFSPGGRGMPLLAELEREIAEGKTVPMEEGFAARRKSRP